MSKSFGKYVTMGICYGSNTEYYRDRRKHQRHVNKQRIRNIIANNNIEEFDEKYNPYNIPKKDNYVEPTDGTYKLTGKKIKKEQKTWLKKFGLYVTKNNKIKK